MIRRGTMAAWLSMAAIAGAGMIVWGCGGKGGGGGPSAPTGPGSMMGRVRDVSGTAVGGASVNVAGQSATANDQGWFFFTNITPADHVRVMVTASNYTPTQRYVDVKPGRNSFLDVHLFNLATPVAIDNAAGGPVTNGGATVTLPAGAFRTAGGTVYSGTANVSLTLVDPSTREQRQGVPGGFEGIPSGQSTPVPFESFGMFNISATDAGGAPLSLGTNVTAVFSLPTQSTGATPPATVPLWKYDESAGAWMEAGTATYVASSNGYVAPVSSSGYWNCDQPYATACVTGKLVTPEGKPAIGGIEVTSEGVSYVGSNTTYTDEGGTFKVFVKASTAGATQTASIYAQGGGLYTDTDTPVNPTPTTLASTGQCTDIGTIQLAYPLASVVLTWGALPPDLDSHFTGPDGAGGRFHMYYGDKNPTGNVASLDTDDTSSYGPEVTSLLKPVAGTYVYSINNYSGEAAGPIKQSGAKILAFFPGETKEFDVSSATGDAGGNDDAVWRVFKFTIDGNGNISHLQPINQIVPYTSDAVYDP